MPFAGTEGYNPVAYAPYVLATAIGNLLGLDFPNMLLLMRFGRHMTNGTGRRSGLEPTCSPIKASSSL